jgi:hydroxymethylpyrimidine/phosphomethylpyrimidine kinase
MFPVVLTIAGSDSSGGAGIQADLKTFAAHDVYGTCALTAVTAQNTREVRRVHALPPDLVTAQIDAVADDIDIHAVKIGVLADAAVASAVAAALTRRQLPNIVLDPVMRASDGRPLLAPGAIAIVRAALLPLALVVTPNAAEAAVLAGFDVVTPADARRAAERIRALGPRAVIVKGGHLRGDEVVDVLVDGTGCLELRGPRVAGGATHGTGCTFASALAAHLAHGRPLRAAAEQAKQYVAAAIGRGLAIGHGHGPLGHFEARRR